MNDLTHSHLIQLQSPYSSDYRRHATNYTYNKLRIPSQVLKQIYSKSLNCLAQIRQMTNHIIFLNLSFLYMMICIQMITPDNEFLSSKYNNTLPGWHPNSRRCVAASFTIWAFIEIRRWVFGRGHAHLKNQILAAGTNPCNGPPREKNPHTDPRKILYISLCKSPCNFLGKGSWVIIRRKNYVTASLQLHGEVSARIVEGIVRHAVWQKPGREALSLQLIIGCAKNIGGFF